MMRKVKPQQIVSEHSIQNLFAPRKCSENLAIRPRNMPELRDHQIRTRFSQHTRKQPKMIILNEYKGGLCSGLFQNCIRKSLVDTPIHFPMLRIENGPRKGHVTQGPQTLIGKTAVITALFFFREPDSLQRVARRVRGDCNPVDLIHRLPVRVAAAIPLAG